MSCCNEKWLDVFVTKPDAQFGEQYTFDDKFLCSVQTVALSSANTSASIVDHPTNFLLPTWSGPYSVGGASSVGGFTDHPLRSVEAGDIVRIGDTRTGHTDYLTVVEVLHVTHIRNLLGGNYAQTPGGFVPISPIDFLDSSATHRKGRLLRTTAPVNGTLEPHSTGLEDVIAGPGETFSLGEDVGTVYRPGTAGIAHIVLRVNVQLNATALPTILYGTGNAALGAAKAYTTRNLAMAARDALTLPMVNPSGNNGVSLDSNGNTATILPMKEEMYPYALYLNKKWSHGTTLYANFDHGVKGLCCIKLVGYSIVNKRQVGVNHQHELMNDDYFILHINEIDGKIVSNNKHANGAFAVLHTPVGMKTEGAIEHSQFDPAGVVTHYFDNCDSTIRSLTIKVTDRRGQPAHIGRLHLWFKLLVIHG